MGNGAGDDVEQLADMGEQAEEGDEKPGKKKRITKWGHGMEITKNAMKKWQQMKKKEVKSELFVQR